jgi:hypothetical protein
MMGVKYEFHYEQGPYGGKRELEGENDEEIKEWAREHVRLIKYDAYVLLKITTEVLDIE